MDKPVTLEGRNPAQEIREQTLKYMVDDRDPKGEIDQYVRHNKLRVKFCKALVANCKLVAQLKLSIAETLEAFASKPFHSQYAKIFIEAVKDGDIR